MVEIDFKGLPVFMYAQFLGVDHLIFEGGVGRIGQRKNFFSCCPMVQAIFFVHKGFAGFFFPCDICCRKFFFSNLFGLIASNRTIIPEICCCDVF